MKKLFTIALTLALLCATVLPMTVNAAGLVLFSDDFSTEDEANWDYADSAFTVVDGRLEGFSDAVCHQSQYLSEYDGENDGNKKWGSGICFKVDVYGLEDDSGSGKNSVYLWWADYFKNENDEYDEDKSRIIYKFGYNFGLKELFLDGQYDDENAKPYCPDPEDETPRLMTKEGVNFKMDISSPEKITLGMRISKTGIITCYCNDELIFTYQADRGATCGTTKRSPVLLYNNGSYCAWDNFVLATEDYNLFNESEVTEAQVTEAQGTEGQTEQGQAQTQTPDTTAIVEKVVTEVGEDGEVVTKIVTEIVTNAPAQDTQKTTGGSTSGGAQTGDMAVIVIAVMVVALGAAVVVKKVSD